MKEGIKVSSVDFVMFTWLNKLEDRELESDDEGEDGKGVQEDQGQEDEDVEAAFARLTTSTSGKPVEIGTRHYSNATIWIGVTPDRLNGARAFELTTQIRAYLDTVGLTSRVDIAFRESVARPLLGTRPALYAPVETNEPLQGFIDNVSVALSLTISGRKTTMQGTLGPYFRHGGKLYAITCRHNLFMADGDNDEYTYNRTSSCFLENRRTIFSDYSVSASAPKREVVLMGKPAFDSYVDSVQAHIGTLNETVKTLKALVQTWSDRVNQGINLPTSQHRLDENQAELVKIERRIVDLKHFYVTLSTKWSKLSNRIIGHIVWSPPIAAGVGPKRFTQDLCVVELYKPKFLAFIGNVLSLGAIVSFRLFILMTLHARFPLGPEISREAFTQLMHERIDVPSGFEYPDHGLLTLRGMLTANDINNTNSLDTQGDRVRRVIKRGFTTLTTVETLSRFISFVRKYNIAGTLESLELAILPHESVTGTFSKSGDSGATVVSPNGKYVGELTSGTNQGTDGSDITYATLFQYVWEVVLAKFPGANL